jgi:hypothetical protein
MINKAYLYYSMYLGDVIYLINFYPRSLSCFVFQTIFILSVIYFTVLYPNYKVNAKLS